MRLKVLLKENQWWVRLSAGTLHMPLGPIVISQYRPKYFGRYYGRLLRKHLETPEHWSKGEAELMAAYVSAVNRCVY